jgi:hypothetical protein
LVGGGYVSSDIVGWAVCVLVGWRDNEVGDDDDDEDEDGEVDDEVELDNTKSLCKGAQRSVRCLEYDCLFNY